MKRLVTALLSVLLVFAKIGSVAALTPSAMSGMSHTSMCSALWLTLTRS